jgi:diacylglycerol kinase (ATP)
VEYSEQKKAVVAGPATNMVVVDRVRVILNPRGGSLTGQAKLATLEQALRQTGLQYQLNSTRNPAHAAELARQAAAEGYPVVVAAGGDGIINHILNGLMEAAGDGEAGVLGIVPLGTANDLADMLGLPRNLAAACRRIAAGQTRLIDVGQVNGRYFVNNSAVGMEPVVTLAQEGMRRVRGRLRYLLAALKSIATAQSWLV